MDFISFLREAGIVKHQLQCPKCGGAMKIGPKRTVSDGVVWICRCVSKKGLVCGTQKLFRNGSWFSCSKLKLEEIFHLTYSIVRGARTCDIMDDFGFSSSILADWNHFTHEMILNHVELTSEKIGGQGKIVEIDEPKFGTRKYHHGHWVEGQWVFGGVERGSGKVFLVAVPDRTQETLIGAIKEWIEPGTVIYSDCWKAYDIISREGFEHLKVNHSIHFKDPETECHTNTIESTWRHVKTTLPSYNRQADFSFYLAVFMFRHSCKEKGLNEFNSFLEIIRGVNWEEFKYKVG